MAQQGLDLAFGLEGTCTSHVSGFGGWPLAVGVGIDGRPTLACRAPDQRLADEQLTPGARQRSAPLDTPRVVSFPPDGRPFGHTSRAVATFGPEADDPFLLGRAATRPDRIAVLGNLIRGIQTTLALQLFHAGQPLGGVSSWTAEPRRQIPGVSAGADRCALGWFDNDALVVAPQRFTGSTLQLLVYVDHGPKSTVTVQVPASRLHLTAEFIVEPWVTSIAADGKILLVGISWVGFDPNTGFRPVGAIDESRASVLRLRRTGGGWAADNNFAQGGLWIAAAKEGEITTADHIAVVASGSVVCVGRATRRGVRSLFAASLDAKGKARWTSRPAPGAMQVPTGIALDASNRVFACGSSRPFDMNYPVNDPAEAVVVCLSPNGQLDAAFGAGGIARFRANGATYAHAIHVTTTGELLVGSIMRWGWNGVGRFHPCITQLTSAGQVDQAFGLGGVARQDGLGGAEVATVDASGRVWSAGVGQTFDGMEPGFRPWEERSRWLPYVSVARLAADGGLETSFGLDGIVNLQLHSLDARLERYSVESLVPLASGAAVLTGDYGELSVNQTTGAIHYQTNGTWVARLTPTGTLDGAFGQGGLEVYPTRWFQLATELTPTAGASYGALQGWEHVNPDPVPLRLAADGTAAAGFGTNGVKTVNPAPESLPLDYAPDGEWFALIRDPQRIGPVGLLRCAADGTIDPTFGAGGPTYDPNDYVDATAIQTATLPAVGAKWENEVGQPHRTLRLADGSYLTLWNAIWQETVQTIGRQSQTFTVEKPSLALLAWTASGKPRLVAEWGNRKAKAIPNAARASTIFGSNWLGWRYRCALLQSDGSLIVGLEGDDAGVAPSNQRPPAVLRTSAYFVRLTSSAFDLDSAFGSGYVVRRLPGEDRQDPAFPGTKKIDYQEPTSIQPLAGGAVVAAVRSKTMSEGAVFTWIGSPDQLADGSVGMMRLI